MSITSFLQTILNNPQKVTNLVELADNLEINHNVAVAAKNAEIVLKKDEGYIYKKPLAKDIDPTDVEVISSLASDLSNNKINAWDIRSALGGYDL